MTKLDATFSHDQVKRHLADVVERRLESWGHYLRSSNRLPGRNSEGYEAENLLWRIMTKKGDQRIVPAPRDWSPEEDVDTAVRCLQLLDPPPAAALYARYVMPIRATSSRDRRTARVCEMRRLLRDAGFPTKVSTHRFQVELAAGRKYVSGWIVASG